MIIFHKCLLLESIKKIVHATTFSAVDGGSKHQGIIAATLTKEQLQTLPLWTWYLK